MLAIVIPTYNEAGSITQLMQQLRARFPDALLIIVDDASPDGTADLVESGTDPLVTVIRRPSKQGIGSAYKEGFAHALQSGVRFIAQMDADGSHDPQDLQAMVAAAGNAGVVIGSRYIKEGRIEGWGPWRHFCSRSAMLFARFVLRVPVRDITSGFRVWRAEALHAVLASGIGSEGYAFQEEMVFRAFQSGQRMIEVPITFRDRRVGQSKLSWRDVVEFFLVMYRLRVGK